MPVEANSSIGSEDLFKILLTQLNYQDPLKPMDNQEFIAQLAQFTTLEQTKQLNDSIENLIQISSSNLGIDLLDRIIQATTEEAVVKGKVITITYNEGIPEFTIVDDQGDFKSGITMSQIEIIDTLNTETN
ncbi:flagellar hook assembly protein FlgD [Marinicellulosiphila megalodicopiae]|uniref:flagellar hook assembly protein FlgD n=1 Tax=Marinicellulosiphila megalodicopiae TaxID=2724896 RepID=UPI003BAF69B8